MGRRKSRALPAWPLCRRRGSSIPMKLAVFGTSKMQGGSCFKQPSLLFSHLEETCAQKEKTAANTLTKAHEISKIIDKQLNIY